MNAITKQETGTSLATEADGNYFANYGAATTQRTIVGDLLKFSKGEFLVGQNADEMPEGTELVANMDELLIGYIRWSGGAPTDHVMGKVSEGYIPPKRGELGDAEKDAWDLDDNGQPRDPWQFSNYLLLKRTDGDQLYTFTTSSRGGLNAIGELCKVYGKEMRQRPNEYPVVALQVDSYRHSNKQFGKIFVPVLKVVGWTSKTAFTDAMQAEAATRKADEPAEKETSRGSGKAAPAGATRF